MDFKYAVYRITNNINGKIYVGVHKTTDLNDGYMGSGELIKKAIKKYGVNNFSKTYLAIFDNIQDMLDMETLVVNEEFVARLDTYNLKIGGVGGDTSSFISYDSSEYKQNVSNGVKRAYAENDNLQTARREVLADTVKQNNGGLFKGKHHSEESKKKIGKKNSIQQKGKGNSQFGTCWIYTLENKCNKKIDKKELQSYLEEGWIKGRKMKWA